MGYWQTGFVSQLPQYHILPHYEWLGFSQASFGSFQGLLCAHSRPFGLAGYVHAVHDVTFGKGAWSRLACKDWLLTGTFNMTEHLACW